MTLTSLTYQVIMIHPKFKHTVMKVPLKDNQKSRKTTLIYQDYFKTLAASLHKTNKMSFILTVPKEEISEC